MKKLTAIFIFFMLLTANVPAVMAGQPSAGIKAFESGQYKTALPLLVSEADNGSVKALYALGLMHEYGLGVEASHSQAASYYFKGAEIETRKKQPVMARMFAAALERTGSDR